MFYGIPYLFGTVGASTRGVDAQHYGFHIFIIFQLAQVSDNLFGVDALFGRSRRTAVNFTVCIIYGNHVSALVFGYVLFHVYHVLNAQHRHVVVLVDAYKGFQVVAYIVFIDQGVYQSVFHALLCGIEHQHAVGLFVQGFYGEVARFGNVARNLSPNGRQVDVHLLAVGRAHFGSDEWFNCRFVCTHFEHLHFHADLFQQVFEEHRGGCQSPPFEHTLRVQHHFVRYAGQVVEALCVGVAVGYDEFARFLEVFQCVANFFKGGVACAQRIGLNINAFDVFVFFGFPDRRENIIQTISLIIVFHEDVQRVFLTAFGQCTVQVQHHNGVLAHLRFRLRGGYHTENYENTDEKQNDARYDNSRYGGERKFQEIFHCLIVFGMLTFLS